MSNSEKTSSTIGKGISWFFAFANVSANYESGSVPAFGTASATALTVLGASAFTKNHRTLAKINAGGLVVNGVVAVASGGLHAAPLITTAVDFLFGTGNWLLGRESNDAILSDPSIQDVRRVINNPASWFGTAYLGTAILASNVLNGHINWWAVAAGVVDASMTVMTVYGLNKNKFKTCSSPFMAITVGSAFGVLAGVLSGNWVGSANKFCSGAGEFLLALNQFIEQKKKPAVQSGMVETTKQSLVDCFYATASEYFEKPVRGAYRFMQSRGYVPAPAVA